MARVVAEIRGIQMNIHEMLDAAKLSGWEPMTTNVSKPNIIRCFAGCGRGMIMLPGDLWFGDDERCSVCGLAHFVCYHCRTTIYEWLKTQRKNNAVKTDNPNRVG